MLLKVFTVGTVVLAIFVGATLQGITSRLGFFRFLGRLNPKSLGLTKHFTPIPWGYSYEQLQREVNLTGRNAIVTGATSGVGYYAALHLARQGANVILACRNPTKCEEVADVMTKNITSSEINAGRVRCMRLDTSSFRSVRNFAASFIQQEGDRPLDILLLNAGIGPRLNELSEDGVEVVFATNHAGQQLLYELLQPNIIQAAKENGDARVVLTSSAGNFDAKTMPLSKEDLMLGSGLDQYSQSKLAQILFAQEATRQIDEQVIVSPENKFLQRVFVNAAHPGFVATNIFEPLFEVFERDDATLHEKLALAGYRILNDKGVLWHAEEGALTILYLATSPEIAMSTVRGRYFHPQACEVQPNSKFASNETLQKELFSFTQSLYKKK